VIKEMQGFLQAAITSPTGTGKTAVFLGLTRGESTIIIEPRKFLQKQIASYSNDFVLFGRSEYSCKYAKNAAVAPCNRKSDCDMVKLPEPCKVQQNCGKAPCKTFQVKDEVVKFPCAGCEYFKAQIEAKRVLRAKGTVITNFGNFWSLLSEAKVVVVDEADQFFREVARPTKLLYSKRGDDKDSIEVLLKREVKGLTEAIKVTPGSAAYSLQNLLYNAEFLLAHHDLCFKYQRKDKIYVEINPVNTKVLKDKIFKGKRLLVVSATLGDFGIPNHSYQVWQRRGTYYCPVGKLTSANLKANPWIMGVAAERIETISAVAEGMFDTRKFPVHCGNLGTHAYAINNELGPDRNHLYCNICGEKVDDISPEEQQVKCPKCGRKWIAKEDVCTMHKAGNLMKTIEDFTTNGKRYLLIAGADFGGDFGWAKVQFILKFPYASLDERMRVLERTMGKEKFNEYYLGEAISRHVQQQGRVCRGAGDFGITINLDSKCYEVFTNYKSRYPRWCIDTTDIHVY